MNDQKKIVIEFIKGHLFGVVATVSGDGKPEAAVMALSSTDELEIIFQTSNESRKYKNLKINNNIAVTMGWDLDEYITLQLEGEAREAEGEEIEKARAIHSAKSPEGSKYAYVPDNKYFFVKPRWLRYWDFKKNEKFVLNF